MDGTASLQQASTIRLTGRSEGFKCAKNQAR